MICCGRSFLRLRLRLRGLVVESATAWIGSGVMAIELLIGACGLPMDIGTFNITQPNDKILILTHTRVNPL